MLCNGNLKFNKYKKEYYFVNRKYKKKVNKIMLTVFDKDKTPIIMNIRFNNNIINNITTSTQYEKMLATTYKLYHCQLMSQLFKRINKRNFTYIIKANL